VANLWQRPHQAAVVAQVEVLQAAARVELEVLEQQGVLRVLVRQAAGRQVVEAARVEPEPLQPAPLAEALAAVVARLWLSPDTIPRHSAN
jgi:hypothetical protein